MNRKMNFLLFVIAIIVIVTSVSCMGRNTVIYDGMTLKQVNAILVEIEKNDQGVRKRLSEAVRNNAPKTERDAILREMHEIDAHTTTFVTGLLREYGWPDRLSFRAFTAIHLAIFHGPLEMMEEFYPLYVERSQKRGLFNVSERNVAGLRDRILASSGQPQLYGTQWQAIFREDGSTVYYVWPIEDFENINSRRATIDKGRWGTFEDFLRSNPSLLFDETLTVEDIRRLGSNDGSE